MQSGQTWRDYFLASLSLLTSLVTPSTFIASSAILVGDKALKKLNPTQKQWLEEAILAGGKVAPAGVMKSEADLVAMFKSRGMGVTTVDTAPFRAAMKPYYDTLETEFGKGEITRIMATN